MLKMTKVELEKINHPDKYMFFEQRMRGGVSYILYLDMNNLYGHAVSQYSSHGNFKWVTNIDKIEQKLMQINIDNSTGYILEVDLEYLQELLDIHNDYPLAPEKTNISKEWLSDYSLEIANAHNIIAGLVKN